MLMCNRHRISSVTFWADFCLAQVEMTTKPLPDCVRIEKRLNDNDNSDNNINALINCHEKCTISTKNLTKRHLTNRAVGARIETTPNQQRPTIL